jgi:hypothetical protein
MDFHMAGPGLYLEMAAEGKTQVLIAGLVKARQPAEPGILSIGPDNPSCIGVARMNCAQVPVTDPCPPLNRNAQVGGPLYQDLVQNRSPNG